MIEFITENQYSLVMLYDEKEYNVSNCKDTVTGFWQNIKFN